jgi:hypothetical protein
VHDDNVDFVEESSGTLDHIEVAQGHRVKGPRDNSNSAHALSVVSTGFNRHADRGKN